VEVKYYRLIPSSYIAVSKETGSPYGRLHYVTHTVDTTFSPSPSPVGIAGKVFLGVDDG